MVYQTIIIGNSVLRCTVSGGRGEALNENVRLWLRFEGTNWTASLVNLEFVCVVMILHDNNNIIIEYYILIAINMRVFYCHRCNLYVRYKRPRCSNKYAKSFGPFNPTIIIFALLKISFRGNVTHTQVCTYTHTAHCSQTDNLWDLIFNDKSFGTSST